MKTKKDLLLLKLKYALRFLNDERYIKLYFRLRMKKKLNLTQPRTFNEKLNWLKLNDRDPRYTFLVDKFRVREYVKKCIGEEILIPLYGVYNSFDDIDVSKLPNAFVLKTNHDSGGVYICYNKQKYDKKLAKKIICGSLKRNFYYIGREWQYKNIKRVILCEENIGHNGIEPIDYKLFCFNGQFKFLMIAESRETGAPKYYFLNSDWKLLKINNTSINLSEKSILHKPENFDSMVKIAERLSSGLYFSRIDLYYVNKKIYFGEITLCPNSGFDSNILPDVDKELGKLLLLPTIDY